VRLACLADSHANPYGLEACLTHARERDVDGFLVAGDLVGKGPLPAETLNLIRELDAPTVKGNVDRRVLEGDIDETGGPPGWTAAQLDGGQRAYLSARPATIELERGGWDVLLVHGSPLSDEDFVFPSITEPALQRKLDGAEPDVLVCGHTHLPFHRELGGVHVVNAGTAGLPYDGVPRPSYVELSLGEEVEARVHRVDYEVERIVEAVRERGNPGARPVVFETGTINGVGKP
jgi:putative phosphoesterase